MRARSALSLVMIVLLATVVGCGGGEETIPKASPTAGASVASPTLPAIMTPTAAPGTPAETPSPAPTAQVEGGTAALSVDAVSGGGIDATRTVSGSEAFALDVVVLEVSSPYRGVQFKLQWDPSVLNYVDQTYPESLPNVFCQLPTVTSDWIYGGCAGQVALSYTGPVATVQLRCASSGTSPLHLIPLSEDPAFGTGAAAEAGAPFTSVLKDATIQCS